MAMDYRTGRSPGFSLHSQFLELLAHFAELVICVSTTKVESQLERQMGTQAPPAFREIIGQFLVCTG